MKGGVLLKVAVAVLLAVAQVAAVKVSKGQGGAIDAQSDRGGDSELHSLEMRKMALEKELNELRTDLEGPARALLGVSFNATTFNERAYNVMSWTLAALGGALGLVLVFGGVQTPKTSSMIVIGYGFGIIAFSVVWFGVAFPTDVSWYVPFVAAYAAGTVLCLLMALAVQALPSSSMFTTILLGAFSYMIVGITWNTAGFYKLGQPDKGAWYMFCIMVGSFFLFGAALHMTLALCGVEKRFLAMGAFAFVGSYLVIKMCGVAALQYPNEWGTLHADPRASTWQYYVMFGMTYLCAGLAVLFQFFVYPIGPDDEFAEGGVLASNHRSAAKSASASQSMPTHASRRRDLAKTQTAQLAEQPEFGSAYAPPMASSAPSQQGVDRYVSHF